MSLALVFNHDSLPFEDIEQAKLGIERFLHVVALCRQQFGINLLLVDDAVGRSLFDVEFATA